MPTEKPFAPAADRNRQVILEALRLELSVDDLVFEFGSGTGQHICHFAAHLPHITWQPSDIAENLPGISLWIAEANCANIRPVVEFDLTHENSGVFKANVCYSANTLHIISWPLVKKLFQRSATILNTNGKLCVYGPFRFNGEHISDSNQRFDMQLRQANPDSGIRDVTALDSLAKQQGFNPCRITTMPANNHLLIWDRSAP